MKNEKIRRYLDEKRMYHYELAEHLGISKDKFCLLLRKEMPDDIQQKILEVIDCATENKPCDVSFMKKYILSQDKRFCGRKRTAENYAKYVARGLDEAEKRRMDGGWDLSL